MGHYHRIQQILDQKAYEKVGDLGKLVKTLDEIGIPWDLLTTTFPGEGVRELIDINLVIPPNRDEHEVAIFRFTPEYKFDHIYIENAIPLGYDIDEDRYMSFGDFRDG